MRFDLITLFPQVVAWFAELGVTGEAIRAGRASLGAWNPRDFVDRGRPDDRAFGGGPGMVLQAEPLARAIDAARAAQPGRAVVGLSPRGEPFGQAAARRLAGGAGLILVCGRYEGIDERLNEACIDFEISLGDFVLSGGELAAMAVMDAILRLLPGVLGDADSATDESFVDGGLEYPHYTRPSNWRDRDIPPVLLSGDHARIRRWRRQQALGQTWLRRPDLIADLELDAESLALLREFIAEVESGSTNNV